MRTTLLALAVLLFLSTPVVAQGSSEGASDFQQAVPEPANTTGPPVRRVRVVNFPDPQNVTGTVEVSNLPTDDNGKIEVSGSPFSRVVVVIDQDMILDPGSGLTAFESEVFDTSEFSTLVARSHPTCPDGCNFGVRCEPVWQWVENEEFLPLGPTVNLNGAGLKAEVLGPRAKIRCLVLPEGSGAGQWILHNFFVYLRRE